MRNSCLRLLLHYTSRAPFSLPSSRSKDKEIHEFTEVRKPRGWECMPYIIGNEIFEKLATFGLSANLTVYLIKHFNMKQVDAANFTNIFYGTTNFAPLLGAFVSDAYLGRFRTLVLGCVACFLGMTLMTITTSVPQLQSQSCSQAAKQAGQCPGPSTAQLSALIMSLVFLVVGSGGVKPCSLPFGVDQFHQTTEKDRKGLNSYFNWYYGTTTAAVMVSLTVVVYIQDNISFTVGFGIPTGFMLLALVFFLLGARLYVHVPPEGSVFSGIAQVFVAAYRKRMLQLPSSDDTNRLQLLLYDPDISNHRIMKLTVTMQFRFLNRAAIKCEGEINQDGFPVNPWRLCSVQQIEEVKCLIRIVPIWASGVVCFLALAQQWSFLVLQALNMDRHFGPHFQIPAGTVVVISMLAVTLFIPIYDQVLVPLARRVTKQESGITLLQRQGIGLALSVASAVTSGAVERRRRDSALAHGGASPMSVLWLAPQLVLVGVAEAFNTVGQIEFYNRQFPEQMQSLAGSLYFCSMAGGNYISGLLVSVVRRVTRSDGGHSWLDNNINAGRVDYYFYLLAAMGVLNLIYFMVCAHYYRYKGAKSPQHTVVP